jgi:hypothetical protein
VDIDVRSPRVLQGVAAGIVLLGFVGDIRLVVPIAALVLLAAYVLLFDAVRRYRTSWIAEMVLLAVAGLLLLAGRAGWTWVLALLAAGIAAMAAIADVWVAPEAEPESRES